MGRTLIESAFALRGVRTVAAVAILIRGLLFNLAGARYRSVEDFCWTVRVPGIAIFRRIAWPRLERLIGDVRENGDNPLVRWFLASGRSRRSADHFTMSGGGPNDLFRDLIVLKAASDRENGVILLKYSRTFEAVVALLDLERLLTRYTFILEPSWAGYCDPALLMYVQRDKPVLIQCFTNEDRSFVDGIGQPLHALGLGPADWVNSDVFSESASTRKDFDLVMVANWGAHKRHRQLFQAIRLIRNRRLRVLLVGFPWAGRTSDDVLREATGIDSRNVSIEIREAVPHHEVALLVASSKVFVFLSRKEGDNKALVEALFSDVPAIVYDRSIGGARNRINPQTGILSSDEDLAQSILYMLDHYREFHPRQWAISHTGSSVATRIVNDELRRIAKVRGEPYTAGIVEKVNEPNLAYREPGLRRRFRSDYDFIVSCQRPRWRSGTQ